METLSGMSLPPVKISSFREMCSIEWKRNTDCSVSSELVHDLLTYLPPVDEGHGGKDNILTTLSRRAEKG